MSSSATKDKQQRMQEKYQAILNSMLREEENKYCADCDSKGPRWASWNLGIFLCIRCAGIHRKLGVHITKVKSINLDQWTAEQIASMQLMGNSKAKAIYESSLSDNYRRSQTDSAMEQFIRSKYEQQKWIQKDWRPSAVVVTPDLLDDDRDKKKQSDVKLELKKPESSGSLKTQAISSKPLTAQNKSASSKDMTTVSSSRIEQPKPSQDLFTFDDNISEHIAPVTININNSNIFNLAQEVQPQHRHQQQSQGYSSEQSNLESIELEFNGMNLMKPAADNDRIDKNSIMALYNMIPPTSSAPITNHNPSNNSNVPHSNFINSAASTNQQLLNQISFQQQQPQRNAFKSTMSGNMTTQMNGNNFMMNGISNSLMPNPKNPTAQYNANMMANNMAGMNLNMLSSNSSGDVSGQKGSTFIQQNTFSNQDLFGQQPAMQPAKIPATNLTNNANLFANMGSTLSSDLWQ